MHTREYNGIWICYFFLVFFVSSSMLMHRQTLAAIAHRSQWYILSIKQKEEGSPYTRKGRWEGLAWCCSVFLDQQCNAETDMTWRPQRYDSTSHGWKNMKLMWLIEGLGLLNDNVVFEGLKDNTRVPCCITGQPPLWYFFKLTCHLAETVSL